MFDRIAKTLRVPVARLAGAAVLLAALPAHSQAPPPLQPALFDPSDFYFDGYLATRSAE